MADKKLTALSDHTTPLGADVLMVVDTSGTAVSKKITLDNLFGTTTTTALTNISLSSSGTTTLASTGALAITATAGATVTGTLETTGLLTATGGVSSATGGITLTNGDIAVGGNLAVTGNLVAETGGTPTTGNTESRPIGTIVWDTTRLYIVTDTNVVKYIDLTTL